MTQRWIFSATAGWVLLAALPLLLLWPALRHAIESRMSLHMLLEFPLLFAAGWAVQRLWPQTGWLQWLDWRGWTGATLTSLVVAISTVFPAMSMSCEFRVVLPLKSTLPFVPSA